MAGDKESHPLVESAKAILSRIEALGEVADEHEGLVIRARAALQQLVIAVDRANPVLLSTRALDSISDHLNQVEMALPALEGTETTASVGDLAAAVEEVLFRLPDIIHIQEPEDVEPIKAAIEGIASFTEEHLKAISEQVDALRTKATELASQIQAADEEHNTKAEAINETLTTLTSAVQVQKEELQTALTSQASLFEAEQEQRKTTFTTIMKEYASAHETSEAEMIKKGEASVLEVSEKAEAVLAQINKRKEEVEATAGAVGLTATISGFATYADQQKESADWWRRVAVGALLAVALLGLVTLIVIDDADLTLQRSLLKGSVGTALALLAGYAGKQSSNHRREERRSRRLGLEVAAFDPYIANLKAPRQESLKEFMALRVFGHLEDPDGEDDKWGEHQPTVREVLDVLRPTKGE